MVVEQHRIIVTFIQFVLTVFWCRSGRI